MNKIKRLIMPLLYLVYSGISGFLTPTFLLMAFNFMDGIKNNPEDEMFIPLGIFALVAVLVIDVWIVLRIILCQSTDKCQKIVVLSLFAIIKIGFILMEQLGLRLFIECFTWKLENQWLR